MFLKGAHIYLRALEPEDLDVLYKWENNTAIWQVSHTQTPFSRFVLEQFLANQHQDIYTNKQLRLMACHNQSHQPVGAIDLFEFDPFHLRVGVGILVDEEQRQNGYAFEMLELLKSYVFQTLLLNQIYCHIGTENKASLKLFEKAGFKTCGLRENWNRISEKEYEDEWMLQLLKP